MTLIVQWLRWVGLCLAILGVITALCLGAGWIWLTFGTLAGIGACVTVSAVLLGTWLWFIEELA